MKIEENKYSTLCALAKNSSKIKSMERHSLLEANGHIGHLRNHSKNVINLSEVKQYPGIGWGSSIENLKQPKNVKCLPES